jgi:shikimate dehydrogenase
VIKEFVLIGHPVAHSLSPAIHRAAYRVLGLPHRYELCDCASKADVAEVVARVRKGEIEGANVTTPWKRLAMTLADRAAPSAQRVGVANVLARSADGAVVAHNTDIPALVEEFQRAKSSLRRAVVIGNGGASPAVISALQDAGVDRIALTARRFVGPEPETEWPHAAEFSVLGVSLFRWPESTLAAKERFRELLARADVIVQCTSAGMQGADDGEAIARMVPFEHVPQSALAYDLIYNPATTPFLARARAAGLRAENGLGMLVAQAALAIELWLNSSPPRAALKSAAELELLARSVT